MQGFFAFIMKEEKKRKLIYTMCTRAFRLLYLCYYLESHTQSTLHLTKKKIETLRLDIYITNIQTHYDQHPRNIV